MREEELDLEPIVVRALSGEALASFRRRAVERTSPADQKSMLTWMLPAMTSSAVEAFLARLPAELTTNLRALIAA
jgi:hypothetical protein